MGAILFIGVVIFIAWVVWIRPHHIVKIINQRLLEGNYIPNMIDDESLMELLNENVHFKNIQKIYFDEDGKVCIIGRYATYHVRTGTGFNNPESKPKLFVAVGKSRFNLAGNEQRDLLAYQEADCLRCHIIKLFDSKFPENPEEKCQAIRKSKVLYWGIVIAIVIFVVAAILPTILETVDRSNGVANSYFTQYSDSVTIGDAFDNFFSNPKWERYDVGGQRYIDFRGGCTYLDEPTTMVITFIDNDETFRISNISVNGYDLSEWLWPVILTTIYSES